MSPFKALGIDLDVVRRLAVHHLIGHLQRLLGLGPCGDFSHLSRCPFFILSVFVLLDFCLSPHQRLSAGHAWQIGESGEVARRRSTRSRGPGRRP